ncbi:hypothetical protein CRUP_014590, partial [Coryphaenoides rupestris]
ESNVYTGSMSKSQGYFSSSTAAIRSSLAALKTTRDVLDSRSLKNSPGGPQCLSSVPACRCHGYCSSFCSCPFGRTPGHSPLKQERVNDSVTSSEDKEEEEDESSSEESDEPSNEISSSNENTALAAAPQWVKKMQTRPHTLPANSMARFRCRASGNPRPSLHWYRAGKELDQDQSSGRFQVIEETWSLIVESVVPSDGGNYTCVVKNLYGSLNHTYVLDVVGKTFSE